MRPYVITSSPRVENFFFSCFNQTTDAFATRMEAYCLAGLNGMYIELQAILDRCTNRSEGLENNFTVEVSTLKRQCTGGVTSQVSK